MRGLNILKADSHGRCIPCHAHPLFFFGKKHTCHLDTTGRPSTGYRYVSITSEKAVNPPLPSMDARALLEGKAKATKAQVAEVTMVHTFLKENAGASFVLRAYTPRRLFSTVRDTIVVVTDNVTSYYKQALKMVFSTLHTLPQRTSRRAVEAMLQDRVR